MSPCADLPSFRPSTEAALLKMPWLYMKENHSLISKHGCRGKEPSEIPSRKHHLLAFLLPYWSQHHTYIFFNPFFLFLFLFSFFFLCFLFSLSFSFPFNPSLFSRCHLCTPPLPQSSQWAPSSCSPFVTLQRTSISQRKASTYIWCPEFYVWCFSFCSCHSGNTP